jgi:hypothetical protein
MPIVNRGRPVMTSVSIGLNSRPASATAVLRTGRVSPKVLARMRPKRREREVFRPKRSAQTARSGRRR